MLERNMFMTATALKLPGRCALLLVALALPIGAVAQTPPVQPAQPSQAQTQRQTGHGMADRVEKRIADLHARLHITAAQQPQWEQFAQVMRDNAHQMRDVVSDRAAKMHAMNAAENMQSYAQLAEQHAQDLRKLAGAFQAVYESLSDEQKRAADEIFRHDAVRHSHTKRTG